MTSEKGRRSNSQARHFESHAVQLEGQYGRMDVSDAKRLRALEDENRKLKKLLAESILDQAALKQLLAKSVGPVAKREAVAFLPDVFQMGERRACLPVAADLAPAA
jgi:putative transposase